MINKKRSIHPRNHSSREIDPILFPNYHTNNDVKVRLPTFSHSIDAPSIYQPIHHCPQPSYLKYSPYRQKTKQTTQQSSHSKPHNQISMVEKLDALYPALINPQKQQKRVVNTSQYVRQSSEQKSSQMNLLEESFQEVDKFSNMTPKYQKHQADVQSINHDNLQGNTSLENTLLQRQSSKQINQQQCMAYVQELLKEIDMKNTALNKSQILIERLMASNEDLIQKLEGKEHENLELMRQVEQLIQKIERQSKVSDSSEQRLKAGYISKNSLINREKCHTDNSVLEILSVDIIKDYVSLYIEQINRVEQTIDQQNRQFTDLHFSNIHSQQAAQIKNLLQLITTHQNQSTITCSHISTIISMYNSLIEKYKRYSQHLYSLLCQSMRHPIFYQSYIKQVNKMIDSFNGSVHDLIPKQLIRITSREVSKKLMGELREQRQQNTQLKEIVWELLKWIEVNVKVSKKEELGEKLNCSKRQSIYGVTQKK